MGGANNQQPQHSPQVIADGALLYPLGQHHEAVTKQQGEQAIELGPHQDVQPGGDGFVPFRPG